MKVANPKKIAVVRANGLGDLIFSLPALQAIKETFPNAELVLLAKKWHKEFLKKRRSPVDRVIVLPKIPGVGEAESFIPNKRELQHFFSSIKNEAFDIAMQMHGGGRYSNPFVKNLGAHLTVGLRTPDAMPLDINIPYVYYQQEYFRYLEVVGSIGASPSNIFPKIFVTDQDLEEANSMLASLLPPFVVIHPGASDMRRRWSAANFAEIGDFLAKKRYTVVITGIDSEKDLVNKITNKMKEPSINAYGKLSLSGLTGLLSLASLVISNDTGPFHLAYALQKPVVGLFWCGNMINGAPTTRTITRPLISWITTCPLCGQDCASQFPFQPHASCKHTISFVSGISTEEVKRTISNMENEGVIVQKEPIFHMPSDTQQHLYE